MECSLIQWIICILVRILILGWLIHCPLFTSHLQKIVYSTAFGWVGHDSRCVERNSRCWHLPKLSILSRGAAQLSELFQHCFAWVSSICSCTCLCLKPMFSFCSHCSVLGSLIPVITWHVIIWHILFASLIPMQSYSPLFIQFCFLLFLKFHPLI